MGTILVIILSFTYVVFGAAFNATDSIINVPIAKQFRKSEVQFGVSCAYIGSPAIETKNDRYDLDYKVVYALDDRNQFAFNVIKAGQLVAHYQHTLTPEHSNDQLSIGVRNITDGPFSTWGNNQFVEESQMSPYIVNTFYSNNVYFSIGYGLGVFQHKTKSISGVGSFIENLNGVFYGVSYVNNNFTISGEYDGLDMNFGIKYSLNDQYDFEIALTEQFIDTETNPQHAGAPKRQITFSFTTKSIYSRSDYYNKEMMRLNEKISKYEAREIKRTEEQKKKKEPLLIKDEDVLKSKIVDLYSQSLKKYNNREYEGSIRLLHKALEIDSENEMVLTRLGSVYYAYGLLDHASFYWAKAYKINPESNDLKSVLPFISGWQ